MDNASVALALPDTGSWDHACATGAQVCDFCIRPASNCCSAISLALQVTVCPITAAADSPTSCSQIESTAASADNNSPCCLLLHLAASLLQLRGSCPSTSPLTDTSGNVLCFNGEVYGGLDIPPGGNDGKCLAAALRTCATADEVVTVLSSLRGPWSVIYWQQKQQLLWFGRDWLG